MARGFARYEKYHWRALSKHPLAWETHHALGFFLGNSIGNRLGNSTPLPLSVDVSDIFYFFCSGEGKGGVRVEGGRVSFFWKCREGLSDRRGGGRGGREGVCREFWGRGAKFFSQVQNARKEWGRLQNMSVSESFRKLHVREKFLVAYCFRVCSVPWRDIFEETFTLKFPFGLLRAGGNEKNLSHVSFLHQSPLRMTSYFPCKSGGSEGAHIEMTWTNVDDQLVLMCSLDGMRNKASNMALTGFCAWLLAAVSQAGLRLLRSERERQRWFRGGTCAQCRGSNQLKLKLEGAGGSRNSFGEHLAPSCCRSLGRQPISSPCAPMCAALVCWHLPVPLHFGSKTQTRFRIQPKTRFQTRRSAAQE